MQPKTLSLLTDFNNLKALQLFAEACTQWMGENKNFRYDVTIENTYFDAGQDWMWTTIIVKDEDDCGRSWQALCPRDWELIVTCDSISKLTDMAWDFMDNIAKGNICVNLYKRFE
jgi:hypothetical protein